MRTESVIRQSPYALRVPLKSRGLKSYDAASAASVRCVWHLHHNLTAVHRQRRAGNESGIVGGEKHHATRDFLWLA